MGYKEEIFERLELSGFRDVSQILDYLAGDKQTVFGKDVKVKYQKPRSRESYIRFARELAEPFEIEDRIDSLSSLDDMREVEEIRKSIRGIKVDVSDKLERKLDKRLSEVISKTVERNLLGEASKQIIGKSITREEYRELWKKDRSSAVRIAIRMKQLR